MFRIAMDTLLHQRMPSQLGDDASPTPSPRFELHSPHLPRGVVHLSQLHPDVFLLHLTRLVVILCLVHAHTSMSASTTFLFHHGSSCSSSLLPHTRHNRRHNACTSGVPFEPEPDLHLNPIHVPFKPEGFGTNAIRSTHGSSTTRRRHFEARLDICAFAHVKGACLELHCNQRKRRHACRDGAEPRGLVQGGTCDPPWTMAKGNVRATPDQGTNATVSLRAADAGGDAVLPDDGLSHHCGMRHGSDLTFLVVLQRGKGVSQV